MPTRAKPAKPFNPNQASYATSTRSKYEKTRRQPQLEIKISLEIFKQNMEISPKNYIFVEPFVSKFVCFKYVCKKILKFTPLWQRLKRWVKLLQI